MKPHFRITSFLFLVVILFSTKTLVAQHTLVGKITDERNRQPLAFVNVVVNEGLQGVISDIDGWYEIVSDEPISKIKVSSIGYESREIAITPDQKKCNVALKPKTFELDEVTVDP